MPDLDTALSCFTPIYTRRTIPNMCFTCEQYTIKCLAYSVPLTKNSTMSLFETAECGSDSEQAPFGGGADRKVSVKL